MKSYIEQHKQTMLRMLILCGVLVGIYIFFRYLFGYIAPFILAWILASALEPLVSFLCKKGRLSRRLASLIAILIVLFFIGLIGTNIVMRIVQEASEFRKQVPQYVQQVMMVVEEWRLRTESFYFTLPEELRIAIDTGTKQMIQGLTSRVGTGVKNGPVDFVIGIPSTILFFVITLIATFFISKDRAYIHGFILKQIPGKWIVKLKLIREDLLDALLGYVRAQMILMMFTATICIVGLAILRYPYALFIGILISIIDALPVFGSGAILIPWAIWSGLTGKISAAVGFGIIYGTVLLTRQLLEPKIVGEQIGVHPLVTLMAIYVGLKIFGVIGIFVGPIIVILIKTLQKMGAIPPWKI